MDQQGHSARERMLVSADEISTLAGAMPSLEEQQRLSTTECCYWSLRSRGERLREGMEIVAFHIPWCCKIQFWQIFIEEIPFLGNIHLKNGFRKKEDAQPSGLCLKVQHLGAIEGEQ